MNVVCVTEKRYYRTPDGKVWTPTGRGYTYWSRYLDVFDHVKVAARVLETEIPEENWLRADGDGVVFSSVPYYVGPWELVSKLSKVKEALENAIVMGEAVVLYAGGPMSTIAAGILRRYGYPYGVYVGGDPYDTFGPRAFAHPLRPFLRWFFTRELQKQCRNACAAQYVTENALQRRYPCSGLSISASGVELRDDALADQPREYATAKNRFRLVTIGTLDVMYKAPDVLIDAVARCVNNGLDLELTFIGDGVHRPRLQERAYEQGIGERTRFLGRLPTGQAVLAELDKADVFVLPSYCEGLPRAMIEAMARALPCIGTCVGGIPELLPPEDMVRPGNVAELAAKISEVVKNPKRMTDMSARNLEKARGFTETVLRERRREFYMYLKTKTQEWVSSHCVGR